MEKLHKKVKKIPKPKIIKDIEEDILRDQIMGSSNDDLPFIENQPKKNHRSKIKYLRKTYEEKDDDYI